MNNTSLRDQVAGERRRLKAVRMALSAALEMGAGGDQAFVPFYVAEADYLETAMGRMHAQDVRMAELITERLGGKLDDSQQAALDEMGRRLEINEKHLRELVSACEALKSEGVAALVRFEQTGRAYTDFITASMGHHGPTTELADRLLSADDWADMAGISAAETQREQQLYDRVVATLPPGLQMPSVA